MVNINLKKTSKTKMNQRRKNLQKEKVKIFKQNEKRTGRKIETNNKVY